MTVDLTKHTDLGRLADSVDQLVARLDRQTASLDNATAAMRRHRWRTWLAIIALAVALAAGAVTAKVWIDGQAREEQQAAAERDAACQRDNQIREAVVRAARVAVETTALAVAGDDPLDQAQARQIAAEVAAEVAVDPGLRLRDCGPDGPPR